MQPQPCIKISIQVLNVSRIVLSRRKQEARCYLDKVIMVRNVYNVRGRCRRTVLWKTRVKS